MRGFTDYHHDNGVYSQARSSSSCDAFKDNCCLDHIVIICRKHEQTGEGELYSCVSQVRPERRKRHRNNWLLIIGLLVSLLIFTFWMGRICRKDDAQDSGASVFFLSQAVWLLGFLLCWTIWLLLRLLQIFLVLVKWLLWFISILVYPLYCSLSFLLTCVLLLLHYLCDAVYAATASPVYYGMFFSIGFFLFILRFSTAGYS